MGNRQESQVTLGAWGGGRVVGRGEGKREGSRGGMGKAQWTGMGGGRKDGYAIREEYISTKGVVLGFIGDLIINEILGPRTDPQIVLWTEERVPEPALAYNHTDEDFAYHHRSFI